MKLLYLDCSMGAAGDMLAAALMELIPDPDAFIDRMNDLQIPGVIVRRNPSVKCGITGTHFSVTVNGKEEGELVHNPHGHEHGYHQDLPCISRHDHDHHKYNDHDDQLPKQDLDLHDQIQNDHFHKQDDRDYDRYDHHDMDSHPHNHHHEHGHHHHSSMQEIEQLISGMEIPEDVRQDVRQIYQSIAEAESHVHGMPVTKIHFHEVGTMDAVADITAVCLLMKELSPDQVIVSPVHVGCGQVRCAHGILPVPAPATAYLLKEVPIYGGSVQGELCTPTGAALLRHFASRFGEMPFMKVQSIGYGMGKKDFEAANCIRAMLGSAPDQTDTMVELSCNVDDMTAEAIGFAMEELFLAGALEVYTVPIGMKKSRPGTLLRVMCKGQDKERLIPLIFRHTTTLGIRENVMNRYVLTRRMETMQTPYGEVRRKTASGYGVTRSKYEYEDLARIAREQQLSLKEVQALLDDLPSSLEDLSSGLKET